MEVKTSLSEAHCLVRSAERAIKHGRFQEAIDNQEKIISLLRYRTVYQEKIISLLRYRTVYQEKIISLLRYRTVYQEKIISLLRYHPVFCEEEKIS